MDRAYYVIIGNFSLHWRHSGRDSVSNRQPHDCLLNRLYRRRSKKTSKLRVTGHCAGNSPGTGEFPVQMASNAENVSIWWRHYGRSRSWLNTIWLDFATKHASHQCKYTSFGYRFRKSHSRDKTVAKYFSLWCDLKQYWQHAWRFQNYRKIVRTGLVPFMITSSNGNIFRVTGPLCGEFTGHRWIPRTKVRDADLWCFLWSAPE